MAAVQGMLFTFSVLLSFSRSQLKKQIRKKTAQFHKENEDKSKFSCEIFLEGMDSTLVTDIKNKVYVVKGGYEGYKRKMEAIKQKYTEKAGLGLKVGQFSLYVCNE